MGCLDAVAGLNRQHDDVRCKSLGHSTTGAQFARVVKIPPIPKIYVSWSPPGERPRGAAATNLVARSYSTTFVDV